MKFNLKDIENIKNIEKTKKPVKEPSKTTLTYLEHLCNIYGINFLSSNDAYEGIKLTQDLKLKYVATYKSILNKINNDYSILNNLIKHYIVASKVLKHYKPEHTPMIFNIFTVKDNLNMFIKLSSIADNSNYRMEWVELKTLFNFDQETPIENEPRPSFKSKKLPPAKE